MLFIASGGQYYDMNTLKRRHWNTGAELIRRRRCRVHRRRPRLADFNSQGLGYGRFAQSARGSQNYDERPQSQRSAHLNCTQCTGRSMVDVSCARRVMRSSPRRDACMSASVHFALHVSYVLS